MDSIQILQISLRLAQEAPILRSGSETTLQSSLLSLNSSGNHFGSLYSLSQKGFQRWGLYITFLLHVHSNVNWNKLGHNAYLENGHLSKQRRGGFQLKLKTDFPTVELHSNCAPVRCGKPFSLGKGAGMDLCFSENGRDPCSR